MIFFIILFFVNDKLLIHLEELKVILQNIQNFFYYIFLRGYKSNLAEKLIISLFFFQIHRFHPFSSSLLPLVQYNQT